MRSSGSWRTRFDRSQALTVSSLSMKHNQCKIPVRKEPCGAFGGLLQWHQVYSEFCRLVHFLKSYLTAPGCHRNLIRRTGLHLYGGDANAACYSQAYNLSSSSVLVSDPGRVWKARSKHYAHHGASQVEHSNLIIISQQVKTQKALIVMKETNLLA